MTTLAHEPEIASATKRIFLVDDHPTLREGLRRLIELLPQLSVCGEAASAAEAMNYLPDAAADLVLMDISLPDKSGLEAIKDLQAVMPELNILAFSMHDEMLYAERALKAGAKGYLMKGVKTEQLMDAIERILAGGIYLSQRVSDRILNGLSRNHPTRIRLDTLSDRELEIFELIGRCRGTTQIAEQLHISPKTVDAHRGNIKAKLGVADAASLLREAVLWLELAGKGGGEDTAKTAG